MIEPKNMKKRKRNPGDPIISPYLDALCQNHVEGTPTDTTTTVFLVRVEGSEKFKVVTRTGKDRIPPPDSRALETSELPARALRCAWILRLRTFDKAIGLDTIHPAVVPPGHGMTEWPTPNSQS